MVAKKLFENDPPAESETQALKKELDAKEAQLRSLSQELLSMEEKLERVTDNYEEDTRAAQGIEENRNLEIAQLIKKIELLERISFLKGRGSSPSW